MDRKTAILQWLNCLTTLDPVNDISDLANGNHFLEFAKTINKVVYEPLETETEEEALERRYNYIKETINSHFHIDCGKLVNFESCKLGSDGNDLVLVILLLLSAMVNHSVYSVVDQTRLTPLHELELTTQEFIRECLESILAAEDELQLFTVISNITSFAIRGTRRSRSSSSPHVSSSSSVTPVLRTRSRQGKAKNSMQSPLKVFMESPNFKQQVSMKEKKKEINDLRRRLNSEENKAIDFENRNNFLVNEMHSKEKEIKELKEKVNFLNPFRELADEYELKKAELQEQLDMFEKKQKICANCKHQENCIKTLEDELFEVKSQNEIMEERCKHFQAQLDAFHKDIVERDSIINRFTISKSEDDDKIQALGVEINRLLSCEAMYKKRYEEEHAQMKTPEPFQTPQRCEGETLKGVIDKMLEEKEAELEKEKAKIKDLEEKINQSQSQLKIKDEYNEKLQRSCSELEVQLTKIEKSEKELNSELSHVTAQYDSCVHQIEILENTFAALKLESLTKEKELQKNISLLSEKNQQQKIELDHSEKDYKKLLTEKEASEKELQLELEQQLNVINGMQTKIIEYVGKITVSTQDCENMQEEINAKKGELVTLQREKSHFETELERSITAQERLRNQHEVACTQFVQARNTDQAGVRGLIDCIGEYDSTVVQWLDIMKNLEEEKISIQEKMTQLEIEKNEIAAESDSWKRNHQVLLTEMETVQNQLNEELKLREKTIEDCKTRIVEREEEIVSLTERCNIIQKERQDEKESAIQLEKQMNNLVSELQILKENYQQLSKEKEMVEAQLTEGFNLRDKSIQGYEAKVAKLQEEIIKLEEGHACVQQEIAVKQEEIIQIQNENVKATAEFELSKQKFEVSLTEKEVSEQQLREELKLTKKSSEDFQAKIINYEEEIVMLMERCNDIQKERQTEKVNVIQLEKQVSEIISELQTSKEHYQRLLIDKEMSEAQLTEGLNLRDKSIEGYETKVVKLTEEIIMLKKDHENAQAELTVKQGEITQLRIEKDKVTSELELSKKKFEELLTAKEVSKQQLKDDLELHEKSIEVFKAKIILCDEEILLLTERCENIQKERQIEKDSLVQMEKQMNEIASELQVSKDDYQQLLKDKEVAEAQLKKELNLRDKSVENYKTKVVEFEEEIIMLKNDCENMQQKIAAKQEEITRLQNEKEEITSEVQLSQQKFEKLITEKMVSEQHLKEELKLHEKSIEDFNAKLIKRDEAILSLTEKCEDIQKERQVEKDSLVQMEQQMNEIISELQISKEGYQQLLKEKDIMEAQLKTELDIQDKSVESYKTKVVEFEEEIVMLKKDRENLQQEIAAKQEEMTQMQNKKVEISSQLELSQQKFEKLLTEKEISEQQLKEELKLHEKSIEDSNAKIMKRDEEILLLKEKCENIQKKSQAGKDSLVEVEKQVNEIISELQVSKEDYQQLLKDKEMAEAQLKTELDHKDNSVESYKTKIVEFEEKIIMLKKDYENVQQEISAKQEEITQLQNGKVKVTAELELFKRNYEKLQEEKEVAEKQLKKALDDRDKIAEDFGVETAEFNKKYLRLQEHHQELEQRVSRSDETVLQCQTENVAVRSELQLIEENYQQLVTNCEMHKTECDGVCDRLKKVTEDNLANIAQHAEEVLKMKDDHEKILAVERENVTRLQTERTKAISELDFFKQNYEKLLIEKETIEKQLKEELHRQKKSTEDFRSVIEKLERKIAALNEERECIQKEQDITKETVFQLQNENTKMVSELALLKENHEKVLMQKQITEKKKLDELHLKQKTIENYELQITELDGRIVILKEELESMKCERDADKEVGIQLQMEKDKAANELNILNETYKKLLAEKDMSERKLNEELQSQKKSNEDYLAKITAFDANIATLKAEFEAIQQEGYSENENRPENEVATELQFLRNTYRQLLMDKETSAKHLNEKLNLQKMLIEDYEYQVAQFDVENEISKKIQEDIQQNMDAERERVNQLQTEMAEVTAKLKLSEEKYEKILTEKQILEKELNEKLNLQEQSVSDREEIIAELHKKITNLKEEQENLMQGKNTEKEIIMQLQNEKNEVITELELLNQNYQKLLTEAEVTQKELSNKLQLRENAITGHKTKISEQDKEILMLTSEKENIPRVSQESVRSAEFELLNENYQKLLSINEATERRLSAECDYLKKTIDNYVAKLVELQNIKKESPNVQLSINPELQKTLQKFSSETEHISNQLCIWAKDRTSLMRKAVDTLKRGEQRNQSLRAELIKTQQGIREIQLTGEGKGDVPLERSEFASTRADTEKEKANWFALRYKKLENAKNEEICNLQTEKNNLLKKLDESLKAAKMSKEKYESEMKKLQKQQDEYKKIAETAMSEIKQMGEKLKSIPKKDDKQLEIVTAKYKKAKEIIEKQNREKKDLGKKLDGATERLKYHEENSNAEAIRISNEECQSLRKELEETKKSNEPLKMRIKELDKARLIQEQTCKSLERDLKLAHGQLVRLRKTAERCDDQSLRRSLSSSSSSSLKTPLIKKSKKEAIIEKKHVYVRERVTRMVDDSFLMPFNPESNFNHSFASTTSEGLNKSVMGAGNLFQCADEEDYLNHSSLESLNHPYPPSATKRLSELQKRNTLCPPHMRSSYAVEMQMQSPSKFSDEALKEGNAVKVSPKRKRSSSADEAQKSDKESKVVVEKKKKKTLKAFSTVNSEKFPWSMANRTPTTVRKFMKNIKGFPSSPKPKVDSFWPFKS